MYTNCVLIDKINIEWENKAYHLLSNRRIVLTSIRWPTVYIQRLDGDINVHNIKMFHSGVERTVDTPWMIQPAEKKQKNN